MKFSHATKKGVAIIVESIKINKHSLPVSNEKEICMKYNNKNYSNRIKTYKDQNFYLININQFTSGSTEPEAYLVLLYVYIKHFLN